jgi:hypothetical protein
MKMNEYLYYDIRHLQNFQKLSDNKDTVWAYRWPDGKPIEIYNLNTKKTIFVLNDLHLAEYLCSLHNMSKKLLKEVETKYDS